tara:strand:+ start:105 stop:1250 length:1146 start_codon:yes stop_codon:yes gene_type:complete
MAIQSKKIYSGNTYNYSRDEEIQYLIIGRTKRKRQELIKDKCRYAVYIIDNSSSMNYNDGKVFMKNNQGEIEKIDNVSRWDEAIHKTTLIADYNIKRGMLAVYYLLNPKDKNMYIQNIDFVVIDPFDNRELQRKKHLLANMLNPSNIRGTTPLDEITQHLELSLQNHFNNSGDIYPICYNIITDGVPNNKIAFEQNILSISKSYNIFLTINLCTNDSFIVNYFNKLDKSIGSEICGCDVIDDLESEQDEVLNAGNTVINYCNEIHITRMAGCYSIVSDLLDEVDLGVHYNVKLCNELLKLRNPPKWRNVNQYMQAVKSANYNIYNFRTHSIKPIVNESKLQYMIYIQLIEEYIWRQYRLYNPFWGILLMIFLSILLSLIFL